MKTKIWKICFLISLIALAAVLLSACDNKSDGSQKEIALRKLTSKTWTLKELTVDGVNKTADFAGFSITFTSTGFTITNPNVIWPSDAPWSFTDEQAKTFTRGNDDLTIRIVNLTDTTLELELEWNKTTYGPGRMKSAGGVYVFLFE